MLPCPKLDWSSNENDPVNEQVAELLTHYEATHGEGLPQDVRDLIKACARALGGTRAQR